MKAIAIPISDASLKDAVLDPAQEKTLRRQINHLHFEAPFEARFRHDYEAESGPDRLALVVVAALSVVLTPFYDIIWLHPPEGFVTIARWLQFGVQLPALILVMVFGLKGLRRWQPLAVMLATLAVAGGLVGQRVVGARFGFWVPVQFSTLTVAAVFAMGRLRFRLFAPWAGLILGGAGGAEIATFGAGARAAYDCIGLAIGWSVVSVGGYVLERAAREAWMRRQQLTYLALHDPLTGLPNRRYFDQMLARAIAKASVTRAPVALMLIDIDHFKSFNDHYGHPAGDACLKKVGAWLHAQAQTPGSGCFCARLGGEEFAALWTGPAAGTARALAERLRRGVGALGIPHARTRDLSAVVTASGGFTHLIPGGWSADAPAQETPGEADTLASRLVARADALLYEAKKSGRDRLAGA